MSRLSVLAALALGLTACVERTISIDSDPQGALVYLNDEEVGRTPLTVPFTFYGVYDVRLERAGYQPLWTKQEAKQPFWEYMGPDLIAETIPGAKARQNWHFTMQPAPAEDPQGVIGRAQAIRAMLQPSATMPATSQPATE